MVVILRFAQDDSRDLEAQKLPRWSLGDRKDMRIAKESVNKHLSAANGRAERWLYADKSVRATPESCR